MTIITRGALEYWGRKPEPDLAYLIKDRSYEPLRKVTWAEVMAERRKKQARILENIRLDRSAECRRALWVHVWFNPFFPYEGWHCYLKGVGGYREWVRDRDVTDDPYGLMTLFPVTLFPISFYDWKQEFATAYKVKMWHGQPVGRVYVWGIFSRSHIKRLEKV